MKIRVVSQYAIFFFFNDTATTEIYTLSLHDALPISFRVKRTLTHFDCESNENSGRAALEERRHRGYIPGKDRKSTRLNSSHGYISYAVFCLKKKNNLKGSVLIA